MMASPAFEGPCLPLSANDGVDVEARIILIEDERTKDDVLRDVALHCAESVWSITRDELPEVIAVTSSLRLQRPSLAIVHCSSYSESVHVLSALGRWGVPAILIGSGNFRNWGAHIIGTFDDPPPLDLLIETILRHAKKPAESGIFLMRSIL